MSSPITLIPTCPRCNSTTNWVSDEPTARGGVRSRLDIDGWTRTSGPAGTTTSEVMDIIIVCSNCGYQVEDEGLWQALADNPVSPRNT